MLGLLLLLLLVAVPFVELAVLVRVAQEVGVATALLLLLAVSVVGVWVAKAAGLGVLRRMQATVSAGRVPSAEVVDGFLILVAGVLMVVPGFVTGAVAVPLLVPPTRAAVRALVLRRVRRGSTWIVGVRGSRGPGITDAESWEVRGRGVPGREDGAGGSRPPGALGP